MRTARRPCGPNTEVGTRSSTWRRAVSTATGSPVAIVAPVTASTASASPPCTVTKTSAGMRAFAPCGIATRLGRVAQRDRRGDHRGIDHRVVGQAERGRARPRLEAQLDEVGRVARVARVGGVGVGVAGAEIVVEEVLVEELAAAIGRGARHEDRRRLPDARVLELRRDGRRGVEDVGPRPRPGAVIERGRPGDARQRAGKRQRHGEGCAEGGHDRSIIGFGARRRKPFPVRTLSRRCRIVGTGKQRRADRPRIASPPDDRTDADPRGDDARPHPRGRGRHRVLEPAAGRTGTHRRRGRRRRVPRDPARCPRRFESQRGLFEALPARPRRAWPRPTSGASSSRRRWTSPPATRLSPRSPRAGVTIAPRRVQRSLRRAASPAPDVMLGAGWVAARGSALRHGRAAPHRAQGRLTELIGPGPRRGGRAADAAQLGVTDYTSARSRGDGRGARRGAVPTARRRSPTSRTTSRA